MHDWLRWQEQLNPRQIELGLERVRSVAGRLRLAPLRCPVVTVGGTNGKGSCVAYLEAALRAGGYRVGAYTSPHLLRYNERIRIDGEEAPDAALCEAFARIEAARGDTALTYFEFGTLAALWLFAAARCDAVLLEVGLGGRLDAVNLVDADVSIITSIGIDHTDWLGSDRESIGREKAGIMRPNRPAVCGDPDPPRSLLEHAAAAGSTLFRCNESFRAELFATAWHWIGWDSRLDSLPYPSLAGAAQLRNAASAIAALQLLRPTLPLSSDAIGKGLRSAALRGRFEVLPGKVPVILDVAHNAEACSLLAENLRAQPVAGRTLAVAGMLRDKPLAEVGAVMAGVVDAWYLGDLRVAGRALNAAELAQALAVQGECFPDPGAAFGAARVASATGDRIVVFGSFHTVEAVLRFLQHASQ